MYLKLSSNLLWLSLGVDVLLITLNVFPIGTRLFDDLFNLDKEANLAVWYSSTKLFVLAVLVWAATEQLSRLKWSLRLAAIAFLCISITETALVHERLFGVAYTMLKGHEPTVGIPGGWIVYFAPVVIAVLACIVICVYRLIQQFAGSRIFMFAGLALWIAALSSELAPYVLGLDDYTAIRPWQLLEESCEVLGTTAFLGGIMQIVVKLESAVATEQT